MNLIGEYNLMRSGQKPSSLMQNGKIIDKTAG
jgi:hypothetical protein